MENPKPFEFFDHTADVGVLITGKTLAELFTHAACALVSLWVEDSPVHSTQQRPIVLQADSVEALLRAWLTQLILWFDSERFVPSTYTLNNVSPTFLQGNIGGELFDPKRHRCGVEVKGVTRHQFEVKRLNDHWEARLILDV